MSPQQLAEQQAALAAQDAAIAKRRKQNKIYGTIWIVVGLGCLAIGTANLLTGAALGFHSLVPVIGGGWSLIKGIDRRRGAE